MTLNLAHHRVLQPQALVGDSGSWSKFSAPVRASDVIRLSNVFHISSRRLLDAVDRGKGSFRRPAGLFLPRTVVGVTTLLAALFLVPRIARAQEENACGTSPNAARAKFSTESPAVVVPVSFLDVCSSFVLDTGATMSAIDSAFAGKLGAPLRTTTVTTGDGSAEIRVFKAPAAKVLGKPFTGVREVLCLDLSHARAASESDFWGVVGMDFLRHRTIQINFDSGEVTFSTAAPPDAGVPFPLEMPEKDLPMVTLTVTGVGDVAFVVDTGSDMGGSLNARVRESLFAKGGAAVVGSSFSGTAIGPSSTSTLRVKEISLGNFRHRGMIFRAGEVNVLGVGYLSRYVVTFDFPRKKLYLKPGAQFDAPSLHYLGGPGIRRADGMTVVAHIIENSTADLAGLEVGDVIQRIDDDEAESLTLSQIRKRFCTPGLRRLRIKRENETLSIALVLIDTDSQADPEKGRSPMKYESPGADHRRE